MHSIISSPDQSLGGFYNSIAAAILQGISAAAPPCRRFRSKSNFPLIHCKDVLILELLHCSLFMLVSWENSNFWPRSCFRIEADNQYCQRRKVPIVRGTETLIINSYKLRREEVLKCAINISWKIQGWRQTYCNSCHWQVDKSDHGQNFDC
jgi:hypothetical protein